MKKRTLFLVLFFAFFGISSYAQITEVYRQGFEASENVNYTVVRGAGNGSVNQTVASSGSKSIKLAHNTGSRVILQLDTIDFSTASAWQYFSMEFSHICNVNPANSATRANVASIEVRRPNQNTWTLLSSGQYNMTEGGTPNFAGVSSFNNQSYSEWSQTGQPADSWWKKERFDLDRLFSGVATSDRKLLVRFILDSATSVQNSAGWYLDDIVIKASPSQMVRPVVTIRAYPDLMNYASSRGAKIVLDATTSVAQGINDDSVYVLYKIGSDPTINRITMTPQAAANGRYMARIPFWGYDTIMQFRVIVRDASTNINTKTFPDNDFDWISYKCVRGTQNEASFDLPQTSTDIPFPADGIARSEFVYDSLLLSNVGYKAGAFTRMQFTIHSCSTPQVRDEFRVWIRNRNTSEATLSSTGTFVSGYMQPVYEGTLNIQPASSGATLNIDFQDTFYYAGSDIVVQVLYRNSLTSGQPAATYVKGVATAANKQSLYVHQPFTLGFDPATTPTFASGATAVTQRPDVVFRSSANLPLIYDAGVSSIIFPAYNNPAQSNADQQVRVYLKNYGVMPVHAINVTYRIDNSAPYTYNWTGTLNAGDSVAVQLNSTQRFTTGYHTITAWVEDSLTSSGTRYRDHEPFNDTSFSEFMACAGPMSGIRTVGTANADYATLEQMLFALASCGVNGPLTIKLAAGEYGPIVMPEIEGTSATAYVQFEPVGDSGSVVFRNDLPTSNSLIDMQNCQHVRLSNLVFRRNATDASVTYMVRMGVRSTGCQVLNCGFVDNVQPYTTTALLYTGAAPSILIEECSFTGGVTGINATGFASDNLTSGNVIVNNFFADQNNNAIIASNQNGVVIQGNFMNNVLTNAGYMLQMLHCYGPSQVVQNKVYSTHGASCIGMSEMYGTATQNALIANNMMVSLDDGVSDILTTPLNIISGEYIKVVYNSVRMYAPEKSGIAAATFGGGNINNSKFINNIVASYDGNNYAFNYIPGNGVGNYISNNLYYTQCPTLNRLSGNNYYNLTSWQNDVQMDSTSRVGNPGFLNGSLVDLRTYNQIVKGWGIPQSDVTVDIFDVARDSVRPCVGAFEFVSLPYDFEITELVSPLPDNCSMPDQTELVVAIYNSGVTNFVPGTSGTLSIRYSTMTQTGTATINCPIPSQDTVICNTGVMLALPSYADQDRTYNIQLQVQSTIDPNVTNDSAQFTVISRYSQAPPTGISVTRTYGVPASVPISAGLDYWNVYGCSNSIMKPSQLYWYADSTATEPLYVGNPLVTTPLYTDTSYYVSQRRDLQMVRISEVQITRNQTVPGISAPMPSWINQNFAVELMNVGDAPAHMLGDTIMVISPTNSLNNKIFVFPDITIQPGANLIVQFGTGSTTSNDRTIYTGRNASCSPSYNSNFAILYRDGSGIADAVAFNSMTTQSVWTNAQVPAYVWSGSGITMPTSNNQTAGVTRTGWHANATTPLSNSASHWMVASNTNRLTMGTSNSNLVRYVDNGCPSGRSLVSVQMSNIPNVDIFLDSIIVDEGCGLGTETVGVRISNYGIQASSQILLHLKSGNTVVDTDTIPALAPNTTMIHCFSQPIIMGYSFDTVFDLTAYVTMSTGEFDPATDTVSRSVTSLYTPEVPAIVYTDSVVYGASANVSVADSTFDDWLIWYDSEGNPIDTALTFVSGPLFVNDTFYVVAAGSNEYDITIGEMASLSAASGYPSPYNPKTKYVKNQYLYTAQELLDAGYTEGRISKVAFNLADVPAATGTYTLDDYTISLGTTDLSVFPTRNATWVPVQECYYASSLQFSDANVGWIEHEFDDYFYWDGVSNIVVQVCYSPATTKSSGARTTYTAATGMVLSKTDANNNLCLPSNTAAPSRSNNRPDIRMTVQGIGCQSTVYDQQGGDDCACPGVSTDTARVGSTLIAINVHGTPQIDATFDFDDTYHNDYNSCGLNNIQARLTNGGNAPMSNYEIEYWVDGVYGTMDSVPVIPAQGDSVISIAQVMFTPGRHNIIIAVTAVGDDISSNDTIVRLANVRFCPGTYTIGADADDHFVDFEAAVDSLHNAGIDGPVVFEVDSGTYNNQLVIGEIDGSSVTNTIVFRSASGARDVQLSHNPTSANAYVVNLNNASNISFESIAFYAGATGNYNNVIDISLSQNIVFENNSFGANTTGSSTNSCVILGDTLDNIMFFNNEFTGGQYSVKTASVVENRSQNILFHDNEFNDFKYRGIELIRTDVVEVLRNRFSTGSTSNGKQQTAIYIEDARFRIDTNELGIPITFRSVDIEKNFISIYDNFNGAKRGIHLVDISGVETTQNNIFNNMVSVYGSTSNNSSGIIIEGSRFLKVFFNTVRVYAGINAATSKAMNLYTGCYQATVKNNIFANLSQGYAYYIANDTAIDLSDYNAIFSNSEAAVPKYMYWGADFEALDSVRVAKGQELHSVNIQPYFVSDTDVHLDNCLYPAMAQYNAEVSDDIDGNIRPQIPAPTIGAHEYDCETHDIAMLEILSPFMPERTDDSPNIETDSVWVHVKIYNSGEATEQNISWNVQIEGLPNTRSITKYIDQLEPREYHYDSVQIICPLGTIDTQTMIAWVSVATDVFTRNDTARSEFFILPAFNMETESVTVEDGCRLHAAPISMTIKNVGYKPIAAGTQIQIRYDATLKSGATSIAQLPLNNIETYTLAEMLDIGQTLTIPFQNPANLYPTGQNNKIQVNVKASHYYQYDIVRDNDTSSNRTVNSYYTPLSPVGEDLYIPYATWDTIWSTQQFSRPVFWYRDSTAEHFYTNGNYNRSRHWDDTPQYFHDSTYYLNCFSHDGGNCPSYYSSVTVHVNAPVAVDAAVEQILRPWSTGTVYMIEDTVKVRLINYGTQPISNIPVTYQFFNANGSTLYQQVTETCTATIAPGQTYDFSFDSLLQVNTPNQTVNYRLRAWTDLPNEMVRLNDTTRGYFAFCSLSEDSYCAPEIASAAGMDITRVSYNTLDNELHALGYDYLNFGTYVNPEVTPLHLIKGSSDTMYISCANSENPYDYDSRARLSVYIDFNRNGWFSESELVIHDITMSNATRSYQLTIPDTSAFGLMKMRVVLDADTNNPSSPCVGTSGGQVQDYLLSIDKNPAEDIDVAIARIASPRDHIISQNRATISFVVANKGATTVDSMVVNYTFTDNTPDTNITNGSFTWTGILDPGQVTSISLPVHVFVEGTTTLNLSVDVPGDTNTTNNVLVFDYHKYHVITLTIFDSFEMADLWYAPQGYNAYTKNYWERGNPQESSGQNLTNSYSPDNVWGTALSEPGRLIVTGKRGNRSYLYSPIIDIAMIQPDTLSFQMAANLAQGSKVTLEYYDYLGQWQKVDAPEVENWYNGDEDRCFEGNTSNYGYVNYFFKTSLIRGNFQQRIQFRFVYETEKGSNANSSYGEGCNIDNFRIGRGQRDIDVGVVDIPYPTDPKFGETIFPQVRIKNYGYDTIRSVNVNYLPWGSILSLQGLWQGILAPGDTTSYTFTNSFTVTNNFPDTFQIAAFTRVNTDVYYDNDTTVKDFVLAPLEHDMSLISMLYPLENVVAGDSIAVTARVRNYGANPVHSSEITYIFNRTTVVTETINFDEYLGPDGLPSMEYFNYTFKTKFPAALGTMSLEAYTDYDQDTYRLNDTVRRQVTGIAAINDLVAKEIVVDRSNTTKTLIELVIHNAGARSVNNFEVGFWYDLDTATMVRETFVRDVPLAALSSGVHVFDFELPEREAPYEFVSAYVRCDEDNDRSNDTTSVIAEQYVDIQVNKILVEENRNDECRVRLQVVNIGNMSLTYNQTISGTINGESVSAMSTRQLDPFVVYHLDFDNTISKDPNRQYTGTAKLRVTRDSNSSNNETNVVEVVNYFDGVPTVLDGDGMTLSQNYPNPFVDETRIDFYLPVGGEVKFFVMDQMGRMVYQETGYYDSGDHSIYFDKPLGASGVYYYGIECNTNRLMRKMVFKQ